MGAEYGLQSGESRRDKMIYTPDLMTAVASTFWPEGNSLDEQMANAEFILRAVNAHEQMLKALKAVNISLIDDEHYQEFKELLLVVARAIAKAGGK
jgi:hypothetical protein